jgi:hypothetical protein
MENHHQLCLHLSGAWNRLLGRAALAVLLAASCVATASAGPLTFAQFHEANGNANANLFAYINNTGNATGDVELVTMPGSTVGGAIPVTFNFLQVGGSLPADLQGNQAATLTMTSSSKQAVQTAFSNTVGNETFDASGALSDVLAITRNTAAAEGNGSRTNLLTMTFTGQLLGFIGGANPSLSGDTALSATVTFTSDFLTFDNGEKNFSLTFSSWGDPRLGNGLQLAFSNLFQSFLPATAAGAGTFAANVVATPEPSTIALAAIGCIALATFRRRRAK